jgi:hypothetical protein
LCPITILTEELAVEVTEVVEVSPALWYFRYIASIFLTLHKRLWARVVLNYETKSKRNITKRNEAKQNIAKRNETKYTKMRNATKFIKMRNETKIY